MTRGPPPTTPLGGWSPQAPTTAREAKKRPSAAPRCPNQNQKPNQKTDRRRSLRRRGPHWEVPYSNWGYPGNPQLPPGRGMVSYPPYLGACTVARKGVEPLFARSFAPSPQLKNIFLGGHFHARACFGAKPTDTISGGPQKTRFTEFSRQCIFLQVQCIFLQLIPHRHT